MIPKFNNKYFISIVVLSLLLTYLFWGPLFPWSPIKIGYKKINFSKGTIYVSEMTDKDSLAFQIDNLIAEEEEFHDLQYNDDFTIIVLNKESNMKRYLPWMTGSGYSVSLGVANLIYIGPVARRSASGIESYLRHELSHLLIGQNTTFSNATKIHEQAWLSEGIAEYFGSRSFYTKDEFIEICKIRNICYSSLIIKNPRDIVLNKLKLNYTFYRFFIEFLIENYGIEKLQKYLKKYIEQPVNYPNFFIDIYKSDVNIILQKFNSQIENHNLKNFNQ